MIWNRDEQAWWLLYTNRRANIDSRGVSWAHATDIDIAASSDGGQTWRYRGILAGIIRMPAGQPSPAPSPRSNPTHTAAPRCKLHGSICAKACRSATATRHLSLA
jgi:hypothetical protein